jgi:hypothetical protein
MLLEHKHWDAMRVGHITEGYWVINGPVVYIQCGSPGYTHDSHPGWNWGRCLKISAQKSK